MQCVVMITSRLRNMFSACVGFPLSNASWVRHRRMQRCTVASPSFFFHYPYMIAPHVGLRVDLRDRLRRVKHETLLVNRGCLIALHCTRKHENNGQCTRARDFSKAQSRKKDVMAARSTFYLDRLHVERSIFRFPGLTYTSKGILRTLAKGNWIIEFFFVGH